MAPYWQIACRTTELGRTLYHVVEPLALKDGAIWEAVLAPAPPVVLLELALVGATDIVLGTPKTEPPQQVQLSEILHKI